MLRLLTMLVSIAALAAVIADELYSVKTGWSSTLAILVAGGGLVAISAVIRNAVPSAPRARGSVPSDPGIPRPPAGAPYRGPH